MKGVGERQVATALIFLTTDAGLIVIKATRVILLVICMLASNSQLAYSTELLGLADLAGIDSRLAGCAAPAKLRPRFSALVDSELMATMLADPRELMELVSAMATPSFVTHAQLCVQREELWSRWLDEAMAWEKQGRAVKVLVSPETLSTWGSAMLDPRFHREVAQRGVQQAVFWLNTFCPDFSNFSMAAKPR